MTRLNGQSVDTCSMALLISFLHLAETCLHQSTMLNAKNSYCLVSRFLVTKSSKTMSAHVLDDIDRYAN